MKWVLGGQAKPPLEQLQYLRTQQQRQPRGYTAKYCVEKAIELLRTYPADEELKKHAAAFISTLTAVNNG